MTEYVAMGLWHANDSVDTGRKQMCSMVMKGVNLKMGA